MLSVLRFELNYRLKRPATYIYFAIMFLMGFGAMAWDGLTVGGGAGLVKDNAPVVISQMMAILVAIPGFFISSAVMGVPVLRDFEHNTASMFFTTPMKKSSYLFGRFFGSLLVLLAIFVGLVLGLMLGSVMPWLDAERMLPFDSWNFLQPFLVFTVSGVFVSGAIFFMGGALSKRLLFVFMQGAGLLVLYVLGTQLLRELDHRELVALIDPFGINLQNVVSQYWSPAQQNTQLFTLEGLTLWNRLIWVGIGLACLAITYVSFSFSTSGKRWLRRKKSATADQEEDLGALHLPQVQLAVGLGINLRRTWALAKLYFREVIRSVPFWAIVAFGMFMLLTSATDLSSMYGTNTIPTTYLILDQISGFTLFFIIIIVFYSGELVWRERDVRIHLIYDALPMPDAVGLIAKFIGLMLVQISLLVVLMITGILIQAFQGYFQFEIGVYLSSLFGEQLLSLTLFTMLAMFIQVMVNQKFLGHAVMVLFFIFTAVAYELGLEHSLFQFGSGSLGRFSDMNSFGHFVTPFSWFQVYWLGFSMILFALAITFSVRGTDTLLRTRAKLAKMRFVRPLLITTAAALVMFVSTGSYIYYNTNLLNEYRNSDETEELRANYEKTLKQFEDLPQPRIVETDLEIDIFPYQRDFHARGYYVLKNKTAVPIERLHLQEGYQQGLTTNYDNITRLDSLGGGATLAESWEAFGYEIYEFERPLAPGDSFRLDFTVDFVTEGFVESGSNTDVVYNGTFFNNGYFPSLGYAASLQLGDDDTRRDYDLEPVERMRERNDSLGQHINLVGDDADHIRFGVTLSTALDQIAIAPGYLQREWEEDGRRYFRYEMDVPMFNFYNIVSARYAVMQEDWVAPHGDTISLEIYYHPGHEYNLDRMMAAMKHSLAYYSEHFSPYQYRQMRIMEFPRYASFAQSFANTVPFSEGIGFILDIGEDDVDIPYYVTAHEMAHQWWGHQVTEASVKGNAMLSETMSQYSALMVMKQRYPREMMQEFLRYELDSYLSGRAGETKKEQPLELVEGQGYIHYRKGSLVMYAMQDYLGEDSINAALRRYVQDWAWRDDRYPTSEDLLGYLRAVTPDSLAYLITDLFETITFYENKTTEASYVPLGDDRYRVSMTLDAQKIRADSTGNETIIDLRDWIDVGVFGETEAGKDTLLYLQKHRFTDEPQTIEVEVQGQPTKAGIDPLYILIDRNPDDNLKTVTEATGS